MNIKTVHFNLGMIAQHNASAPAKPFVCPWCVTPILPEQATEDIAHMRFHLRCASELARMRGICGIPVVTFNNHKNFNDAPAENDAAAKIQRG